jgi:hypothetical protein
MDTGAVVHCRRIRDRAIGVRAPVGAVGREAATACADAGPGAPCPAQCHGPEDARRSQLPGRDRRQSQHAVGRYVRHTRRLPLGLATRCDARSVRPDRSGPGPRRRTDPRPFHRHAGTRRPLGPEHLPERRALLDRLAVGRNRIPGAAGGETP